MIWDVISWKIQPYHGFEGSGKVGEKIGTLQNKFFCTIYSGYSRYECINTSKSLFYIDFKPPEHLKKSRFHPPETLFLTLTFPKSIIWTREMRFLEKVFLILFFYAVDCNAYFLTGHRPLFRFFQHLWSQVSKKKCEKSIKKTFSKEKIFEKKSQKISKL